jgi:surface antigen
MNNAFRFGSAQICSNHIVTNFTWRETMLKTIRNSVFAIIGITAVAVTATPVAAGPYSKSYKVVKTVKKVTYYNGSNRHYRKQNRKALRAQRQAQRRWQRNNRRQVTHHRQVIRHKTVIHHVPVRPRYNPTPRYNRTYGNGSVAGGLIGAAVGGLLGSNIGKGSGRTAAIIGGVIVGAVVGGNIGDSMDRADRLEAYNALETAKTGQNVSWSNPDTGSEYSVQPTRTYRLSSGQYCRDYTTWGWIDGYETKLNGTACRMADGSWKTVS